MTHVKNIANIDTDTFSLYFLIE